MQEKKETPENENGPQTTAKLDSPDLSPLLPSLSFRSPFFANLIRAIQTNNKAHTRTN